MAFDPSRVSFTAKLAAYYRQFSGIPFAREVAALVQADRAHADFLAAHKLDPAQLTFYAPMFEARYESVSALLRRHGATQVLELASGFSTRGLDLTRSETIHYVETDLPGVVEEKRRLLDALRTAHGIPPTPRLELVAADVLDAAAVQGAVARLHRDRPLFVLCEGLLLYLTRDEIDRLARHVRDLLLEFAGGAWITADFTFASEVRDLPPERKRLRDAVYGVTDRRLEGSAFEDEAELDAFLRDRGFDVTVRRQLDEAPELSSVSALGLSPAPIERLRPRLRLWEARPRR